MSKRVLPVIPAALGCALWGLLSAPAAAATNVALDGTWMPDSYSDKLLASDGHAPPLTKAAAKIYAERIAAHGDPDRQYDRTRWCAGPGMPRIMFMPYAFEIRSDGDYVGFIYNWYRWHRVADMSGQKADPVLPTTMGYPVGHWDGDTLVIDTVGTGTKPCSTRWACLIRRIWSLPSGCRSCLMAISRTASRSPIPRTTPGRGKR
jgi:hypothetical protein